MLAWLVEHVLTVQQKLPFRINDHKCRMAVRQNHASVTDHTVASCSWPCMQQMQQTG